MLIFWLRHNLLSLIASALVASVFFETANAEQTLDQFLTQVQTQNRQVLSLASKSQNAPLNARQADLLYSPQLSADASLIRDAKPTQTLGVVYDRVEATKATVGVAQQFEFGLQAKLKYEMQSSKMVDLKVQGLSVPSGTDYTATPVAELSLPLWQNSGGKQTAETARLLRAQAELENQSAKATLDGILLEAEMRYWNLSARQAVTRIQQKYFEKTSALVNYVRRRVNSNLGDESELFQVTAAHEASQLELESARQDELSAWQEYNAAREANSNDNGPVILGTNDIDQLNAPESKPGTKHATQALAAANQLSQANSAISADKLRPSLDAFASLALNNSEDKFGDAVASSFDANKPTSVIGVRFSMPLGMGAVEDARKGAIESAKNSQLDYEAKLAQEDRDFALLSQKMAAAKRKLQLSKAIEVAQKNKLDNESKRLKVGRTTLFTVLQFEQDLLRSQLGTVRALAEVLTLNGQIKLFAKAS